MKKNFKILMILSLGLLTFLGCEQDPDMNMPEMRKAVIPKIAKDITQSQTIFLNDLPNFAASVKVDLYWPNDKPKSMDLLLTMNDNPSRTVLINQNITSWPQTFNFTVNDLYNLVPEIDDETDLGPGDFFRFYANLTLEDGSVVNGLDTLYAPYGSAIANLPNSSTSAIYKVIACGYEPALASGSFNAVSESWAVDGDIEITVDPEDNTTVYVTGLETIDGNVEDLGPLVMHIDPATFEVTVDKTVLVSTVSWGPYTNLAYEGSGSFDPCTGTYEMNFLISVREGTFGTFSFTITKNL